MRPDPAVNHMLLDYHAMTKKYGALDWNKFVVVWREADALMNAGLAAGLAPEEVPDLLVTDSATPRAESFQRRLLEIRLDKRRRGRDES